MRQTTIIPNLFQFFLFKRPIEKIIRSKDNGTSRDLAWNSIYRTIDITLPTATTASKTIYVGAIYNSTDSKWDVVSVAEEA